MINEDEFNKLHLDLEKAYETVAAAAIKKGLMTKVEWETRFKFYRDEVGHSFIHLLECVMASEGINTFLTSNPIMLENKKELQDRFKIEILTLDEFSKKMKQ